MRSQDSKHRKANSSIYFRARLISLWRDQVAGKALRISTLLVLFLFGVIFVFFWRLPPEIPLTYSRPWGAEQLVPSFFLFFVFLLTLLVVSINSALASLLLSSQQLLARMLVWISVVFVLLIDITVLRVVLLIT